MMKAQSWLNFVQNFRAIPLDRALPAVVVFLGLHDATQQQNQKSTQTPVCNIFARQTAPVGRTAGI